MELYQEYKLVSKTQLKLLKNFVDIHAPELAKKGHPIHVILTTAQKKRNGQQNKRYWGYLLKHIATNVWADGRQYSPDVWHEFFAKKFGICEDIEIPGGEVILRRKSTTTMTISEFTNYMRDVETYAVTDLNIRWQDIMDEK